MCGRCASSKANPFGKTLSSRALLAWACSSMVASGSSRTSMAVIEFWGSCSGITSSAPVLSGLGKDDAPVTLHAHHGDPILVRFLQSFVKRTQSELTVIGDFSLGVVMVKEKGHTWTVARLGVPQHRQITVRVAESQDRAAPHVQGDVLGLSLAIVEAVEFRELHKTCPVPVHFEPQLIARADHLLGRNAIDLLSECAHEIDAAT